MNTSYGPWPTDRRTACLLGVRHYLDGRPCRRGHHALRFTGTRNCTECKKALKYGYRAARRAIRLGEAA